MFIYLKANLFNDLFYILKEILNLAICCYNILVMEFLGCYISLSLCQLGPDRQAFHLPPAAAESRPS
jgi:hypothetical protein